MPHPLFDIAGRTALVTGSSAGIGLALARGLAQAGCRVVLNGRDPARLAAAGAALEAEGADVRAVEADVTDPAAVQRAVAVVEDEVGPLDLLVNNAGVQHRAPLLDLAVEDWHRVLDTDLTSAFLVGREAARAMVPRGHGKIVNIASVQSSLARPGIAAYSAAKGGLAMLTRAMCAELAGSGLQVNALAPGYVETALTAALVEDPEFSAWVRRRTPAGRWGRVEDLVGTLLYLASPAADFVNGQVVHVDGGMTAVV